MSGAFLVLALLRFETLAPDPWEWDEVLFTRAVRNGLDVRLNHPHPPGYPVFVRAGQALHALGIDPFRAATLAGGLGGFLSLWALYLLLRELDFSRPFALLGAVLYALTPSVWLHGVRPLSDASGIAMFLFAAIFLVRAVGGRPGPNLVLGAAFSAVAAGVRPQVGVALLPMAVLAAVRVLRRERRPGTLVTAVGVAVVISVFIWFPVFRSSGGFAAWKAYTDVQMAHLSRFDSPHGEDALRPEFWKRWMLDPAGGGAAAVVFLGVGALGLVSIGRRRDLLLLLFVPLAVFTIAVCPTEVAPRYALAFWPLPCALAAAAFERAAARPALERAAAVGAVSLLAAFAVLAVPAVVEVATVPSPSVEVMRAVRAAGIDPAHVFVCPMLEVHAREFLDPQAFVVEDAGPESTPQGAFFICADRISTDLPPRAVTAYASRILPVISRGRYLTSGLWDGCAPRVDEGIPVSVEEPGEGSRVTSPVRVRGWCQERGGGRVDPVEFCVDGAVYRSLPVTRVARPDVANAIPEIGDAGAAGWEARLPSLPPGRHTLRVTFQTGDRRRTYPERSFVVEEPGRP